MKNILKAASGFFATIPGISVLTSGAMAPPDYSKLFGAFIEIAGVATLLLVLLNQKTWAKTSAATTRHAIISGASAVVLFLVYIAIFNICVITVKQRGTTYFPLWTSGELAQMIQKYGSREAVVDQIGEAGAYEMVERQPALARTTTTAVLIVLSAATASCLVLCFGILASRIKKEKIIVPGG